MGIGSENRTIIGVRKPCWLDGGLNVARRRNGVLVSWISNSIHATAQRSLYWKIFDNLGRLQLDEEEGLHFFARESTTIAINENRTAVSVSKIDQLEIFVIGIDGKKEANSTVVSRNSLQLVGNPILSYSSEKLWSLYVEEDPQNHHHLKATIFDSLTLTLVNNFTIIDDKMDQLQPSVTKLENDHILVSWLNRTRPIQYVAQIFSPDGNSVINPFPVSEFHPELANKYPWPTTVTVAAIPNGFLVVHFAHEVGSATRAYLGRRFTMDGAPLGSEFTVEKTIQNYYVRARILTLDDSFIIVWQNQGVLYGKKYDSKTGDVQLGPFLMNQRNRALGANEMFNLLSISIHHFIMVWFANYNVFLKRFSIDTLSNLPKDIDDPISVIEQTVMSEFSECIENRISPTLIKRKDDFFIGWRGSNRVAFGRSLFINETGALNLGPTSKLQKKLQIMDNYFSIVPLGFNRSVFSWTPEESNKILANLTLSFFSDNNVVIEEKMLSHTSETLPRQDDQTALFAIKDQGNASIFWNCAGKHGGAICSCSVDGEGAITETSVVIDDMQTKYLLVGAARLTSQNIAITLIEETALRHPIHVIFLDRLGNSLLKTFLLNSDGFHKPNRISITPFPSTDRFAIFWQKSHKGNSITEVRGKVFFENGTAMSEQFLIDTGNVGGPFAIPFHNGLFLTWRNGGNIMGSLISGNKNITLSPVIPISLTQGANFANPNGLIIDEERALVAWKGISGIHARVLNLSLYASHDTQIQTMIPSTSHGQWTFDSTDTSSFYRGTRTIADMTQLLHTPETLSGGLIVLITTVTIVACCSLLAGVGYFLSQRKMIPSDETEINEKPYTDPPSAHTITSEYGVVRFTPHEVYDHPQVNSNDASTHYDAVSSPLQ